MKNLVFRDKVLELVTFILLINLTPSFDSIIGFYLTDYLKFDAEDLSNFNAFGTLCYALGLIMYYFYFKDISKKIFYISTNFILWMINISFLLVVLNELEVIGIDNKVFCFLT